MCDDFNLCPFVNHSELNLEKISEEEIRYYFEQESSKIESNKDLEIPHFLKTPRNVTIYNIRLWLKNQDKKTVALWERALPELKNFNLK